MKVKNRFEADAAILHYLHFAFLHPFCRVSEIGRDEESYDKVTTPILPLSCNISTDHYEHWESDRIKYDIYANAILYAIERTIKKHGKLNPIVMVLGAGQGPLVAEVFKVRDLIRKQIQNGKILNGFNPSEFEPQIYAIEKNPNAYPKFRERYQSASTVRLIESDMREWKPGFKADVIVSELLGGFGCNELSPECLDGCRHLYNSDTIILPFSYTSYLVPIASDTMRRALKISFESKSECSYDSWIVGWGDRRYEISNADYKPVFQFHHPNALSADSSLYKDKLIDWKAHADCHLDAFYGCFDTQLLPTSSHDEKEFRISTVPTRYTSGLHSWAAVMFPFAEFM